MKISRWMNDELDGKNGIARTTSSYVTLITSIIVALCIIATIFLAAINLYIFLTTNQSLNIDQIIPIIGLLSGTALLINILVFDY